MDMRQAPFLRRSSKPVLTGAYPTSASAINRRRKLAQTIGPLAVVWQVVALASSLLTSGCGEKFDGPPEIIPAELLFDASSAGARLRPILDGDTGDRKSVGE